MTQPDAVDPDRSLARARSLARRVVQSRLRPPPTLTVSEWADRYRVLPSTSAEPGKWRTDRVPYLREIMDCFSDPHIKRVAVIKGAQVGYSELLLNVMGYFIDQDPAPILLVQISTGEAAKFSKERVAPAIAECPRLAARVAPSRSRDSSNTIESKDFPGGHLGIVGANAPSGLRSRARRVVLFDEVDGYPPSAGDEGDPLELARKRQTTFWNAVECIGSTPTIRDLSKIEEAVAECDELRRYWVPCPECQEPHVMEWRNVRWEKRDMGEGKVAHLVDTAHMVCEGCGSEIHEGSKQWMLRNGEWRADEPYDGRPSRIAYHISGLMSPWLKWSNLAREFLDAQGNPEKLKVFVNTRLGETWDAQGSTVDPDSIMARRREYAPDPLPDGVVVITAGVDVQGDRLEVEIVGWGEGDESWSLDYLRIPGDPTGPAIWAQLEMDVLMRQYRHPSGVQLDVSATAIDSGFLTQQVYAFVQDRMHLKAWAIKGVDGEGKPIMGRPHLRTKGRVPLYPVGTFAAKAVIYGRLRIEEPGPGFMHFPLRHPYDEEFFNQLTAEKAVVRMSRNGYAKREWVRRPNRRAEVLDCRVYATAAFEGLKAGGLRVEHIKQMLEEVSVEPQQEAEVEESSWVYGFR